MMEKILKLIRYGLSGSCGALVHLGTLFILTDLAGVHYLIGTSIGYLLAYSVSFFLQKKWTFKNSDNSRLKTQMLLFFLVGVSNLFLNGLGMRLAVERIGLHHLLAQVLVSGTIAVWSFLFYRWIFRNQTETDDRKKKTILVASGIYPPDIGGPANYVRILEQELPKQGLAVKVVTFSDRAGTADEPDVVRVRRKRNFLLKYLEYFWKVFSRGRQADWLYAQGPVASGLPVFLAAKILRKRYFLKVVGDYAWERGQQKAGIRDLINDFQSRRYDRATEAVRWVEKTVARSAAKVIVPSEFLKNIVVGWGAPAGRVKVVYNAVKKACLDESREELRRRLGFSGPAMVSAGRFVPWKGFLTLIDLMPELLKPYPDLSLIIIGDGPDWPLCGQRVKELGLAGRVLLPGKQEQAVLWQYIKASDLFVLNTAYEGLSHLLVEALSLEATVAASRVGGNPEIIKDQVNGFLFDYNDKGQIKAVVKRVLSGPVNLEPGQGLERFSRELMIKNLIKELYEST